MYSSRSKVFSPHKRSLLGRTRGHLCTASWSAATEQQYFGFGGRLEIIHLDVELLIPAFKLLNPWNLVNQGCQILTSQYCFWDAARQSLVSLEFMLRPGLMKAGSATTCSPDNFLKTSSGIWTVLASYSYRQRSNISACFIFQITETTEFYNNQVQIPCLEESFGANLESWRHSAKQIVPRPFCKGKKMKYTCNQARACKRQHNTTIFA